MKTQGFTLIEILVALAIFSIIGGAAFNMLFFGIGAQRNALLRQSLVDQTSFVLEYMSRAIRQAQKAEDGSCIVDGLNYESTALNRIKFIDINDNCREIFLEDNVIKETIDTETLPLTSNDLFIQSLEFIIDGASGADDIQPRVTFVMEVQDQNQNNKLILQTTISQRQYDI